MMDFEWIVTKPDEDGYFDAACITAHRLAQIDWVGFTDLSVFQEEDDTVFINTKADVDQLKLLINLGLTREEINDYFSKESQ